MPYGLIGQPPWPARYPFSDAAPLVTRDGLAFAPGWAVDAKVHARGFTGAPSLTSVTVTAAGAVLAFGDAATPSLAVCGPVVAGAAPPRVLPLTAPDGALAGVLVVSPDIAALAGWPPGAHVFDPGSAELVPSAVVPRPEIGVTRVGAGADGFVTGDVWLVGGAGTTWSVGTGGAIVFNAVGDPLAPQAACPGTFVAPVPLRSINGVPPASDGSFLIAPVAGPAGTALRIVSRGPSTLAIGLAGAR